MEDGSSINASEIVLNAFPGNDYVQQQNPSAAETPTEDRPQDTSRKGYFFGKGPAFQHENEDALQKNYKSSSVLTPSNSRLHTLLI